MERLIENKLKEIVTKATITDVEDNHPVNVCSVMRDWIKLENYPVVVATVFKSNIERNQFGAVIKVYYAIIYVITLSDNEDEVLNQNTTIRQRVEDSLRSNQRLDRLADNTDNETVYDVEIVDIDFDAQGVLDSGYLTAMSAMNLKVSTDKVGPF